MLSDELLAQGELVRDLERAEEGDVALDLRIAGCLNVPGLGRAASGDSMLLSELSAETVDIIVGEVAVPFTRSLDAAVPGENIVMCMFSKRRGKWVAVHRGDAGSESVAWAKTEPLARRAAALRGAAALGGAERPLPANADGNGVGGAAGIPSGSVPPEGAAAARMSDPETAVQGPAGTSGDWKIGF